MKKHFLLSLVMLSGIAVADTVMYTTRDHPPDRADPSVTVVWLDEADHLQETWLQSQGVAVTPDNADRIAALLQTPEWQVQEQAMVQAYQGIIRAWQLGVERWPAVVVDDRLVVYGLTDTDRAVAEIARHRQQNGG